MKKFTSALLAVTALTAANAFAAGAVDSKTGAYVGGNVGMGSTNVKYSYTNLGTNPTISDPGSATGGAIGSGANSSVVQAGKAEAGKLNPLFGMFAGYGMQVGTMYFGGEVYGGFDSAKVTASDDTGTGNGTVSATGIGTSPIYVKGKASVKRTNFYGLAPRLGFFVTPSTMLYIKLGIEAGKWTATVNPGGVAANSTTVKDDGTALRAYKGDKNAISFVPGLGLDAFVTKNLFLRAEYSYLFGPSITVKQNTSFNQSWSGDSVTHKFQITQQTFKVGVGYKF